MATYNELASNYATNAKNEYLNSLSYLTDDLAAQNTLNQEALTQKYNNLFDQITRQQDVVNQNYAQDAQAAYLNKLLAGRALDESLSQLGLSTGGFGVGQRLANETAYGQNLAALQQTRSEGLRDIANQLTDAQGEYNVANAELGSEYLAQLLAAKQTQQSMADDKYKLAYNQFLADLQYQDELKQYEEQFAYQKEQDKIANAQKLAQLNAAISSINSGNSSGSATSEETQDEITTDPATHDKLYNAINFAVNSGFVTDNVLATAKDSYYKAVANAVNEGKLSDSDADKLADMIESISIKKPKQYVNAGDLPLGYTPLDVSTVRF